MQNNLQELINKIKEFPISNIISDYISLEKKGNNYIGLCPFHSDSNPSMSISDSKEIFKCFSCGASGGVINFVQNYEGISFIEAVKKISEKLNINWKKYISSKSKEIDPLEILGTKINNEALVFFEYNLKNNNDMELNDYLKKREIDKEIIEKFNIGFAPKNKSLCVFLKQKGFLEKEIVKYGFGKIFNDKLIDYFRDRIIFTIKNDDNQIVGFSGRIYKNGVNQVKYLNSPETPLFKKSKVFYNINNAKIKANLLKEMIIVEGFMDVISLYKTKIENVVAIMGTNFSREHVDTLKKIVNTVVFAFDSDIAGINSMISNGKKMINSKLKIEVVEIPFRKDLDELFKEKGEKFVKEVINTKKSFFSFYKNKIFEVLEKKKDDFPLEVLQKLLDLLSLYNDEILFNKTLNEVSEKFKIDKEVLSKRINNKNKNKINSIEFSFIEKIKLKLIEIEEEILYKLILNDNNFKIFSKKQKNLYIDDKNINILKGYKKFKLSSDKLLPDEIINFKRNYENKKRESLIINEIEDDDTFDQLLTQYKRYFNKYNRQKLVNDIKKNKEINEQKVLLNILVSTNN